MLSRAVLKMAAIFISFVHEDEKVAAAVKALIEDELKLPEKVFLSGDKTLVYAGDRWLDKITRALKPRWTPKTGH